MTILLSSKRALATVFAVFVAISVSIAAPALAQNKRLTDEQTRELIIGTKQKDFYLTLEKHFPKDAKLLLRTLSKTPLLKDPQTVVRRMSLVGQKIRRKNSKFLKTAPDDHLKQVLRIERKAFATFRKSPLLCNKVLLGDLASLTVDQRTRLAKTVEPETHKVYLAMAAGRNTPKRWGKPKNDDYGRFASALIRAGLSDEEMELLDKPNVKDPRTCKVFLTFFDVAINAKFKGSQRVRAELAYDVTSY